MPFMVVKLDNIENQRYSSLLKYKICVLSVQASSVYMCIFKIMLYEHISMFLNMFYPVENVIIQIGFFCCLHFAFVQFNETFLEHLFCVGAHSLVGVDRHERTEDDTP